MSLMEKCCDIGNFFLCEIVRTGKRISSFYTFHFEIRVHLFFFVFFDFFDFLPKSILSVQLTDAIRWRQQPFIF